MGDATMMDDAENQVAAVGVRGPLVLDDVLFMAKRAQKFGPLQVVRDDRVVGFDHIRSAAQHATRALAEGRAKADRPEVEFTRFLAARRTIREAIEHVGIPAGARTGIVVAMGEMRHAGIEYFCEQLGLDFDDSLIVADDAHLEAFGITQAQRDATDPTLHLDLALEAVASVDLMRS